MIHKTYPPQIWMEMRKLSLFGPLKAVVLQFQIIISEETPHFAAEHGQRPMEILLSLLFFSMLMKMELRTIFREIPSKISIMPTRVIMAGMEFTLTVAPIM